MRPAICKPVAPRTAVAMARSHMRMRERSPMFTQSDTAPIVQKCVLLPTAPKMKARRKAPPVTYGTSAAGLPGVRLGSTLGFGERGHALLRARGSGGLRILGDELFERLLRALAVAHCFLRAGDGEHRIGRLVALGPGSE